MASIAARVVKQGIRARVKKEQHSPDKMLKHLRSAIQVPEFLDLSPPGVKVRKDTVAGVQGFWLEIPKPKMTILYLHGGGFIAGNPRMYFAFCGQLAKRLNANIFLPDYRKAPEHPFPAAPDDCIAVYEALIKANQTQAIVIAGDSAGGNLTLVTLLRAKQRKLTLPNCAVTISPATDVTDVYSRQANNHSDDMFYKSMIDLIKDLYLNGVDPEHPDVSPTKGEFKGLPPIMVTVSESEALRDDGYKVVSKAKKASTPVELIRRKNMPHVWPVMYPILPEARADLKRLVKFIENYT